MSELRVVACPNPFEVASVDMALPAGLSIGDILEIVQPDPVLRRHAHIFVDDIEVDPKAWHQVVPKEGQIVSVRVVPHGGGGKKNPLQTILSIVLIAATAWIGGAGGLAVGGWFTAGSPSAYALAGVVGMAGSLAIAALAPPPTIDMGALSGSNAKDSPTLSIAGARNQAAPYRPIPKIYGRHRLTPFYGAPPYTVLRGQVQYLHLLFVLGYGPLQVHEDTFKIGETPLSEYEGVHYEVRTGETDDIPISLYPGQVTETSVGALIDNASGWVQQTTQPDADAASIDVVFNQGLVWFDNNGNKQPATVVFDVEFRKVGYTSWTQVHPAHHFDQRTIKLDPARGRRWVCYGEAGGAYETFDRIDLICIHKLHGWVQVIKGKETIGTPVAPACPADYYPVAEVVPAGYDRWSQFGYLPSVTDVRPAELKGLDPNTCAPTAVASDATYRAGAVSLAAGSFTTELLSCTAKSTSMMRYGVHIDFPTRGQYEVRIQRTTADSSDSKVFDKAYWSVLRSIKNDSPVAMQGLAQVALVIKATDQLSGVIDTFNCEVESVLPDWDGSTWQKMPTANPAAIYRDILQGSAMKYPVADARLDLPTLQAWHDSCRLNGYEFNGVIDYQTTPFEMLQQVAAVGRARPLMRDGLFSVVHDSQALIDAGPKMLLTPRNSWDVRGERMFQKVHGVKVRFVNAELGYRQDEVTVYADGYDSSTATKIDEMDLAGITNYDQAYKAARYYLAVALLRPEMHSRMVDAEHLVVTTGDLIRVVDDVALHGLAAGRIKSVTTDGSGTVTAIELDEAMTMEAGKTYGVRIRLADNSQVYRAVNTVAGETTSLTLATSIAPPNVPAEGDLVAFGESSQETAEKIVHHIEMFGDLTARIYYVDAAPGVYTADGQAIPPYNPQITMPANVAEQPPPAPTIVAVVSDESAMDFGPDGRARFNIAVNVAPGSSGAALSRMYELQYRESGTDNPWQVVGPTEATTLTAANVVRGETYDLRVRAISDYGQVSAWTTATETVVGMSQTPGAPGNLRVENSTGDGVTFAAPDCLLAWDVPSANPWDSAARIDHYRIEIWDTAFASKKGSYEVRQPTFAFTMEANKALPGGPYRTLGVRVVAVDIYGGDGAPASLVATNPQTPQITGLAATGEFRVARLTWDDIADPSLAGIEIHASQSVSFTPDATSLQVVVPPGTREHRLSLADGIWYLRVGGFDRFGTDGMVYSGEVSVTVSSTVDATSVTNFYEEISKLYDVPVTLGAVWSVDGTNLSWNAHTLFYKGVQYDINSGSTTGGAPYIYWDKNVATTTYQQTTSQSTFDALDRSADQWQIAVNHGSSYDLAWVARANMVIGTAMIGKAAVQNAQIGDVIQSNSFIWDITGGNCAGWRFDKTGQLQCAAIEVRAADGTLILSTNGVELAKVNGAGTLAGLDTADWSSDVSNKPTSFAGVNILPDWASVFNGIDLTNITSVNQTTTLDTSTPGPISNATLKFNKFNNNPYTYLPKVVDYAFPMTGGQKWLFSIYAKHDGVSSKGIKCFMHWDDGTGTQKWANFFAQTTGTWDRYWGVFDLTAYPDVTRFNIRIDNDGDIGSNLWVDGIMIEPYIEGQTEPSPFVRPLPGAGAMAALDEINSSNYATFIKYLNADQIQAGTLDAAQINVTNLSADSITSGTLVGRDIKTANSGTYIYINGTANDIKFYNNDMEIGRLYPGYDPRSDTYGVLFTSERVGNVIRSMYSPTPRLSAYAEWNINADTTVNVTNNDPMMTLAAYRGFGDIYPLYKNGLYINVYGDMGAASNFAVEAKNVSGDGVRAAGASGSYDFRAIGAGTNGPFTGAHDGLLPRGINPTPGDILVDVRKFFSKQLADAICIQDISTQPFQKAVVGVFQESAEISVRLGIVRNPDQLEGWIGDINLLCNDYVRCVFLSVGEGHINVVAEGGDIEIGDLIVASSIPGKGMRQHDDIIRSYTVARARESASWTEEEKAAGVIKQIACIYHCG